MDPCWLTRRSQLGSAKPILISKVNSKIPYFVFAVISDVKALVLEVPEHCRMFFAQSVLVREIEVI